MDWLAYDPQLVSRWGGPGTGRAARFCYQRKFVLALNGRKVAEHRSVMLTGKTGVRIMTAFPLRDPDDDYCREQATRAGTVIYQKYNS